VKQGVRSWISGVDKNFALVSAVDTETNELLYTNLEPTTTKVLAHWFLREL
jgi:hypothetical protein